jgi:hypothetical protein
MIESPSKGHPVEVGEHRQMRRTATLLRGVGVLILLVVMGVFIFGGYIFYFAAKITSSDAREYNNPVDPSKRDQTFITMNGWKYRNFDGGKFAAEWLSKADEQPCPEHIYATDADGTTILVWWKPDKSGVTYTYGGVGWDKHDPKTLYLPELPNRVPIGLGGRGWQQFLYFEAKPPPEEKAREFAPCMSKPVTSHESSPANAQTTTSSLSPKQFSR